MIGLKVMRLVCLTITICLIACKPSMKIASPTDQQRFEQMLLANAEMQSFLKNKDSLNIQIIYTKIDRNKKNQPIFTDYSFSLNADNYFYPASTVKMPIAFLALEKLNDLKAKGIDKYTTMITDSSYKGQAVTYTDPLAEDSKPCIANYIKEIFLVSDNEACNRLYEFLGQEYIYNKLKEKGYNNSIIRHRLAVVLSQEQNRNTNSVNFYDTAGNVLHEQSAQYSKAVYPEKQIKFGKGYYSGNKLVNEPFDFSLKNRVGLNDLHQQIKAVLFPVSVEEKQRFNISGDDREFVLRWMSTYPTESKYPAYDPKEYPNTYAKFLGRKIIADSSIRIFSKSGWAYGFLTDVCYVIDTKNNVEFMLSATILCNADGIFNDDKYDYESTGYPFMGLLGEMMYKHELQRKRKHQPDLTEFCFNYHEN
jgi:hypothetical protein